MKRPTFGWGNRFSLWLLGVAFSGSHCRNECLAFVLAIKLFIRLARFVWQPLGCRVCAINAGIGAIKFVAARCEQGLLQAYLVIPIELRAGDFGTSGLLDFWRPRVEIPIPGFAIRNLLLKC